jgi:hypothetical protein
MTRANRSAALAASGKIGAIDKVKMAINVRRILIRRQSSQKRRRSEPCASTTLSHGNRIIKPGQQALSTGCEGRVCATIYRDRLAGGARPEPPIKAGQVQQSRHFAARRAANVADM